MPADIGLLTDTLMPLLSILRRYAISAAADSAAAASIICQRSVFAQRFSRALSLPCRHFDVAAAMLFRQFTPPPPRSSPARFHFRQITPLLFRFRQAAAFAAARLSPHLCFHSSFRRSVSLFAVRCFHAFSPCFLSLPFHCLRYADTPPPIDALMA